MFCVSLQNALGYHCDKGLLSSLVSWIVAGNVTPSFVEGNANSSQVSGTMVLHKQPWEKQHTGVCFFLLSWVFVDFLLFFLSPYLSFYKYSCDKILILLNRALQIYYTNESRGILPHRNFVGSVSKNA